MFLLRDTIVVSAVIFNTVNFFIAWYFTSYWVGEFYKENPVGAVWLLVSVISTNGLLSSTYNWVSWWMTRELEDSEDSHDYYWIRRQTFRRPRPSSSSHSGSQKEV